jgi:hypothetical protein
MDGLRQLAARRRQLQELLERGKGDAVWMGQVEQLTAGLEAAGGGEILFQLASGYRANGRLDLAADTYFLLVRRYPDHSLAEPALAWLVQYYASSEAGRRATDISLVDLRQTAPEFGPQLPATGENGVGQASAVASIEPEGAPAVGLSRDDRLRRAAQLGDYLDTSRPLLYAAPEVRFPLVVAERELGLRNPASRYFLTLGKLPPNDPWRRCAETEEWLAKPGDAPPPKPLAHCQRVSERPHLDGRLDEPFWQSAEMLALKGGQQKVENNGPEGTDGIVRPTVRLAYDADFFYVAVNCPNVAGGDYHADDRRRPRDADLTAHDRVALRLDMDRDFTTSYELVVDHRGWTHEACWGEKSWDPQWFVAAAEDGQSWTVEAAVPLRELVAEPPAARHVWAAAVRRTIPRVGYQSWSGDPDQNDSPEQFGLLIFD